MSARYYTWLANLAGQDAQLLGLATLAGLAVLGMAAIRVWPARWRSAARGAASVFGLVIYAALFAMAVAEVVGRAGAGGLAVAGLGH